jgi:hypothetical protein
MVQDEWSPLRQEPEAPLNNATSRDCELAPVWLLRGTREYALSTPAGPGDAKSRDCLKDGPDDGQPRERGK